MVVPGGFFMSEYLLKLLDAFYQAKRVDHYYWMHTDGDTGQISVENIQKIVGWLTGVDIEKLEVEVDSEFHRAFIERFDFGKTCKIYVIASETVPWKRFAAVKELCHILIDGEDHFQPDPAQTIVGLKVASGIFDEQGTPEAQSEQLAETIALELVYPLEFRRADLEKIGKGVSPEAISELRAIPVNHVHRALQPEMFELCEFIWSKLRVVDPINLNDYLQKDGLP